MDTGGTPEKKRTLADRLRALVRRITGRKEPVRAVATVPAARFPIADGLRDLIERQVALIASESIRYPYNLLAEPSTGAWLWHKKIPLPSKAGREWEAVNLHIEHEGMLRIVTGVDEADPIDLFTTALRTSPLSVHIRSLLYAAADTPLCVWIYSDRAFVVRSVDARMRLAPEVIKTWRERHLAEHGWVGSVPHKDSVAGSEFYRENPELSTAIAGPDPDLAAERNQQI